MMRRSRKNRKGNTLLEFGLVAIFLVPLFLGTVNLGMNLGRSVQVSQVARDAGHLYVRQMDFSLSGSKDLIVRMSTGLGMTTNGGNGTVILSRVLKIGPAECQAGTGSTACGNLGQVVHTQRYVIGNSSLKSSEFGTPSSAIILTTAVPSQGLKAGDIRPSDYTTNASAVATGFATVLPGMVDGETAYVAEAYFSSPDWSLQQNYTSTAPGVYARSIY
ncbi:MAG: hypothetical protein R2729_06635 [Bryobacteraceae bacterium]